METRYQLIANIHINYTNLLKDFVGLSVNISAILELLKIITLVIVIFVVLYLLGEKISKIFLKENINNNVAPFLYISLGYVFFGTGIAVLGMMSLFYSEFLISYLLLCIGIAVYPRNTLEARFRNIPNLVKQCREDCMKHSLLYVGIFGFVLIGFLKLFIPETGVDAIWYHTDYPRLYLKLHSMMNIDPQGKYYPAVVPSLADMYYVITQFFGLKDASRYIHYGFYFLVVALFLLGFKKKGFGANVYACLLFVTSPVVIRHTSTAYNEFQWILCWLITVYIITSERDVTYRKLILAGILFGGTLATKLWMLPFSVVFLLYFCIYFYKNGLSIILKKSIVFIIVAFLIPLIWYMRAFIITGNPLFPTLWIYPTGESYSASSLISLSNFSLENLLKRLTIIYSISPFTIIGAIFLFASATRKEIIKNRLFSVFAIILSLVHFLIAYNWHRFVLPFYSVIVLILGYGIKNFLSKHVLFKFAASFSFFVLFLYYFSNTMLTLPYGLGWANKNKYLTRILSRDNSSYYDYDHRFSSKINNSDKVATYGLWGFYYADFDYFYSEDVFRKKERSLAVLSRQGATMLLIKGGDVDWLCKTENLKGCRDKKYTLLSSYIFSYTSASQYLYAL